MPPPDDDDPVTILGAGIVGICTALSLLDRGVPVRLIDKGQPGQETSMGNAGVISPWSIIPQATPSTWKTIPKLLFGYGRPLSISPKTYAQIIPWGWKFLRQGTEEKMRATANAMSLLCDPSIEFYRRHLISTGNDTLIKDSCYVHAFRNADRVSLSSLDCEIRKEKGAELELVGSDALRKLEPALSPDFKAALLIKNQARAVSPGRLATVLANKARTLGAEIITSEIIALRPQDGQWVITCKDDRFTSTKIVIAMGAWSLKLLKDIGMSMPLMAERGYHIEAPLPQIELNNSVMDTDAKFVASSMEGGLRIAGQAEFAPLDAPPNPKRKAQLDKLAKAAFPELSTSNARFWMGHRPSFPDSLPVIEEASDHPGLFLNFGHSHYGLMMAPKSGDLTAQLVTGQKPNLDHRVFASQRFKPSKI